MMDSPQMLAGRTSYTKTQRNAWYDPDSNEPPKGGETQGGLMTQMLKRAFDEASQGPEALQDAIAVLVLAELASEQRWDESFCRSQDTLAALAEEALDEHRAGRSEPLDLESL
jgi:hypothetical protein